jgi:hypothetical protein
MILPRFVWNEYFTVSPATAHVYSEYSSRLNYSSGSVYVLNCLFNRITSGSYGGALYCSGSVTYLLIESSSFFTCRTSAKYGGAIYFQNTNNGESVLHEVCGYDCCSTYTGDVPYDQFALIYIKNVASSKNYFNYSSISHCVNERSDSRHTVRLYYGKICCPSVNLSMNKCGVCSGILCQPYYDSSSITCSVSYSSFTDNNAPGYNFNHFTNLDGKCEMKSCNVLRNTHGPSSGGIISANGNLNIEDSCILENTATYIFYTHNSYSITLSNCTVDKTTNSGYLTIKNIVTKSFILGLNHISTQNCFSEYDSAGTLTAIPFVSQTAKKLFCYTCNPCQGRNIFLFSLHWEFLFTFVHPNPLL